MGQKDLEQSDFYEDKGRFADVFNGVLFDGREVMKPEELETEDSVMVSHRGKNNGKKVICDKVRKWKGRYASAKAISGMLGVKIDMEKIRTEDEKGRVVYNMCKAFDDHKEEGRREGKREGKREGRREGELEMVRMIKNLMKNQRVNFDDAAKILGISKSRQKKLSALM